MSKELEEAINRALKTKQRGTCIISSEILETALNYIDNSIPKEVVEEKINYYKGAVNNEDYEKLYNSSVVDTEIIIEFLQELLEGK